MFNAPICRMRSQSNGHLAALRASLGHPEPFYLKYVEIGNEVGHNIVNCSSAAHYSGPLFKDFFASESSVFLC